MSKHALRPLLFALAVLAGLPACWMPPYDQALSESERLVAELGDPVFTISATLREYDAEGGFYLPPRDPLRYDSGFWIKRFDGSARIRSVAYDAFSGEYRFVGWDAGDRDAYGRQAVLSAAAADPNYLIVKANDTSGLVRLWRDAAGNLTPSGDFASPDQIGAGSHRRG